MFGQSSDKGSIMAGINYNKTDEVLAGHRDFSKNSVSLYGTVDARAIGPSASSAVRRHRLSATSRRRPRSVTSFRTARFLARNPGATGLNVATDYHCYVNNRHADDPSDKYNFATVNLIMTPQERTRPVPQRQLQADRQRRSLSLGHAQQDLVGLQLAPDPLTRPAARHFGGQLLQPVRYRLPDAAASVHDALVTARQPHARHSAPTPIRFDGPQGFVRRLERPAVELGSRHGLRPCQRLDPRPTGLPNLTKLNQDTGPSFLGTDGVVHCGTAGCADQRLHAGQHLQPRRSEHDRGA